MTTCSSCERWLTTRKTIYDDGSEVVNFHAADGKGLCGHLGLEMPAAFGCILYGLRSGMPVEISRKDGAPWQHSASGPCPDCSGKGNPNAGAAPEENEVSSRSCHRCAGTGMVRHYDDGYIGEERTRLHPKEREMMRKPTCAGCQREVEPDWFACPSCGVKLDAARPVEVIRDALSIS